MYLSLRLLLIRLCALGALTVSAVLLVSLLALTPCEQVGLYRGTRLYGISLPLVGVVVFAVLLALALVPARWTHRLLWPVALLVGGAAVILVLLQGVVLGSWCPYCLVINGLAVVLAAAAVVPQPLGPLPAPALWHRLLWSTGLTAAVGVPLAWYGWHAMQPPPAPPVVPEAVRERQVPGKITVLEITDFQSGDAKTVHDHLNTLLQEHGGQAEVVRVFLPFPRTPEARAAVRAYHAAVEQGKGPEMASALFAAEDRRYLNFMGQLSFAPSADTPPLCLQPEDCEKCAEEVGLDRAAYRASVSSPATEQRIEADLEWLKRAGLRRIPTVWIQDQELPGLGSMEALQAAWEKALAQRQSP